MRKALLAMLVLALAVPAMADVAITASDIGNQQLQISFNATGTGVAVRGIALKLTVTGGSLQTGAYVASSSAFNTFVDYAFSNSGYTIGAGHPLANPAAAGVLVFPATVASVSVGYLDQGGAQAGLTSGVVATLQLSGIANGGSASVVIEADTLRGGAVVGDSLGVITLPASAVLVAGPAGTEVVTVNSLAKTTAAPAIATRVNAGRVETFAAAASSTLGAVTLQYSFDFGDGVWTAWGAASQTKTYSYVATTSYNVKVKARNQSTLVESAEFGPVVVTSEAVKSTATFYATWAAWGRPGCWAYNRNCRGDTNSLATGLGTSRQWVNSADLTLLAAAYNKNEAGVAAVTNGICADFNRLATGLGTSRQWVNSADLTILAAYYNKNEAGTPICLQTNYHYWTTNLIPN